MTSSDIKLALRPHRFASTPAAYSENGRRRLLFAAQSLLKDQKLYNSTLDGKEGKGTHNAIILF